MNVIEEHNKYGLVGHPIKHSLSPYIHRKLMEAAGIDATYDSIDIEPTAFPTQLPRLLASYRGLNCTIPYKERVLSLLDSLDDQAASLRSVNTIQIGRAHV